MLNAPSIFDFMHIGPEIILGLWGLLVVLLDVSVLRGRSSTVRGRFLGVLSIVGALLALSIQEL